MKKTIISFVVAITLASQLFTITAFADKGIGKQLQISSNSSAVKTVTEALQQSQETITITLAPGSCDSGVVASFVQPLGESLPPTIAFIPTLQDHLFTGWYGYSEEDGFFRYYDGNGIRLWSGDVNYKSDYTLYAGWQPLPVKTLTIYLDSGDVSEEAVSFVQTIGESLPLMLDSIPTRQGYIFCGWYEYSVDNGFYWMYDGAGHRMWNGIVNYDKSDSFTLYAAWLSVSQI